MPPERILVVTNRDYAGQIRSVLPEVPPENIIGSRLPAIPVRASRWRPRWSPRGGGGCGDADVARRPRDRTGRAAARGAEGRGGTGRDRPGWLFTIGVNPTEPATGYGYIHCGGALETGTGTRFFRGLGFKEKPDAATAERFLAAGCYRWNSGMFIWQVRSLMQAFERYAPQLAGLFRDVLEMERRNALETELPERFVKEPRISIDYAVMEKAENVGVAECRFDWDDLGQLARVAEPPEAGFRRQPGRRPVCRCGLPQPDRLRPSRPSGRRDRCGGSGDRGDGGCDPGLPGDQAQRIKELLKLADSRPELREFL